MKAYVVTHISGYTARKEPIYRQFTVNAADWQAARKQGRNQCITLGVVFVAVRVSAVGGTVDMFPIAPIQKPDKVRSLKRYVGQSVVFDTFTDKHVTDRKDPLHTTLKPCYTGTFWGTLTADNGNGIATVQTPVKTFHVKTEHITSTSLVKPRM